MQGGPGGPVRKAQTAPDPSPRQGPELLWGSICLQVQAQHGPSCLSSASEHPPRGQQLPATMGALPAGCRVQAATPSPSATFPPAVSQLCCGVSHGPQGLRGFRTGASSPLLVLASCAALRGPWASSLVELTEEILKLLMELVFRLVRSGELSLARVLRKNILDKVDQKKLLRCANSDQPLAARGVAAR